MQSRRLSALEAVVNLLVGYAISATVTAIVLPWFGYHVSGGDALGIALVFTVVSLVRSYVLRRMFNWWGAR